jgi:hypothetical protein
LASNEFFGLNAHTKHHFWTLSLTAAPLNSNSILFTKDQIIVDFYLIEKGCF